jgi:uncharacterized protein
VKLWVGSRELEAEIARTLVQVRTGMMFRTQMGPGEAMLFVYAAPRQVAYYMKNTPIPLSSAYIDSEGTILEIHDMQPNDDTRILSRSDNVQFVLEVRSGWFEKNQIGPGVLVRPEHGTLLNLVGNPSREQ